MSRVPYPLKDGERAKAQGIASESPRFSTDNIVTVVEERGKYARILPTKMRLYEVGVKTGKSFKTDYCWWLYPDAKSGQIWVEKTRLEAI